MNLSDRFVAKLSGTKVGQGNSPKTVAEFIRKNWSVNQEEWPDVETVEEFYAEIPNNLKTLALARGAEFEFGYQFVPNNPTNIKAALRISPVCIAVTAWHEDNGVYVRGPFPENHWTTIIKVLDNGNYLCFDSFYPFEKEVHPSACQSIAMSYYLNRNVVSDSWFKKFIKQILAYFMENNPESVTEPTPPVTPPPAPEKPSDSRLLAALIKVESGGDDYAIGDKHLAHKAYGCLQIRQPYMDDVNRYLKTNYKAQDCLGNRELSVIAARAYFKLYKCTTDEEKARIHNGGPSAKTPGTKMYAATTAYWNKVRSYL